MQIQKALGVYKTNQFSTMSKEKLLLMLYEGALKFLARAQAALEGGDNDSVHNNLIKVQDILLELNNSLDKQRGGVVAENLELLYDYMYDRLVEANVQKKVEPIREVESMLMDLRDTWNDAINLYRYGSWAK
ncbi:MAG: flagellar export chaperone FliS [Bacillota bacterium]